MSESIVLYTHPDCSYSDALKEELTDLALDFEEINLALNPEVWEKVEELTLYLIDANKRIEQLENQLEKMLARKQELQL